MTSLATKSDVETNRAELALIQGDLSKLTEQERLAYYQTVCRSVGLNPATKPFGYLSFQGKLILYATRNCTDQLRAIHGVSMVAHEIRDADGILFATVTMRDSTGRTDTEIGAVPIKNLQGEALANAWMKCLTKAKRRCTLSLCGLSTLDETETDTMSGSMIVEVGETVRQTSEDHHGDKAPTKPVSKGLGKPHLEEEGAKLVKNAKRRDMLLLEFTRMFNLANGAGNLPAGWQEHIKSAYGVGSLKDASVDQIGHLIDWVTPYLPIERDEPFTEPGLD